VTNVASRTGNIIKNGLNVFERGKYLLQSILHFVLWLCQSLEIALEVSNLRRRKTDLSERGSALKGLN